MKKSLLSLTVAAAAAGVIFAAAPKDPVLMTVANKPVTLSEFEYLYHKNNSQQMAPQTIDEYLQMFITYKQKVAAAEDAGIDQTQAFQKEFDGYRRDLAEPYMTIQAVEDSIINAEYARMDTEIDVSHIMVALQGKTPQDDQRALLNSIRDSIINYGADFEQMARKYSIDRAVVRNGGHMGYIKAATLPYTFEDAAFATPVGQISDVIATPFGYHIVKVNNRRPAQGQVLAEHILKLTKGLPEEEQARKKAQIDSIYQVIIAGGDFEAIAQAESEDPGSAKNGGKLPWFGTGRMVPEFEQVAFSLENGAVSKPFATSYGYHIVKRLDHRGLDSLPAVKPQIQAVMARDGRAAMARQRKVDQLRAKFGVKTIDNNVDAARQRILSNGSLDSALVRSFILDNTVLARAGKKDIVLLSEVASELSPMPDAIAAADMFTRVVENSINNATVEMERKDLAQNNPDYRNLLNEYRDGMLLFEISDRNVWSKAKNDKEGLEKFFNDNRDKYTWDSPKFKSYVVFATSDSIASLAKDYLDKNNVAPDSVVTVLRKQFGKDVKVEKVIAAKGENAITDYLGFGGDKPEAKGKWAYYFAWRDKVIAAPEEAADERGKVTTDYQNELEEEWKAELARKYPAKVNNKVLKQAK